MYSTLRAWRATPPRASLVTLGLAGALVWVLAEYFIVSDAWRMGTQARQSLESNARQATDAKARDMARVINDVYVGTRTVSLLPAVRKPVPQNRATEADDVIDGKRFAETDAQTATQLYAYMAEALSVSEIYIVYDGFAPERGEVPFLMFDSIIVDRFRKLTRPPVQAEAAPADPDTPPETEDEEYVEIVKQLKQFKREHPSLPAMAPQDVASLVSGRLVTCDNSQYLSLGKGNPLDRAGLLFSVPIYDLETAQFKGLVTTIVRLNALEARLVDWPLIPVLAEEHAQIKSLGLDRSPPSDYVLENTQTGVRIFDRRNPAIADIAAGRTRAAFTSSKALDGPAGMAWTLSQHVPQAAIDDIDSKVQRAILTESGIAAALIVTLTGVVLLFVSQRRNAARLKELAEFDALTGLPNRRRIDRAIDAELRRGDQSPWRFSVVMVDLDNFKAVNDSLGHHIGDLLLVEVARRFQKHLHATDSPAPGGEPPIAAPMIGRLGGDEFLIVLPGVGDADAACALGERLLSALAVPMFIEGYTLNARASMGVASYPEHGDSPAQLLRSADQAMYAAKRMDDSAVVVFERDADPAAVRRLRLTGDLRSALAQGQFELHYQCVVNLGRGRVDSAEALLRWRHPEFGMVSTAEFVPLLERTGLVIPVGLWALRQACEQLKRWQHSGSMIEGVAVNVSVVQLAQSDFSADAIQVLESTGINPANLTIEVTESVLMDNPERSVAQLQTLRDAGLRIAIDDFGTGYSSLAYLRRLPVQIMKIDRALLIDAVHPTGRAILAAMVELADELGLDCVAEGVETLEQYGLLGEVGCHRLQGYLFARPLPAADADAAARRLDLSNVLATGGMFGDSAAARLGRRSLMGELGH